MLRGLRIASRPAAPSRAEAAASADCVVIIISFPRAPTRPAQDTRGRAPRPPERWLSMLGLLPSSVAAPGNDIREPPRRPPGKRLHVFLRGPTDPRRRRP